MASNIKYISGTIHNVFACRLRTYVSNGAVTQVKATNKEDMDELSEDGGIAQNIDEIYELVLHFTVEL